jgi:folate-binding protein YgfZ
MTITEKISQIKPATVIHHFPFDVIKMVGDEAVDFLQRIATNDFTDFIEGKVQKTLLVTDKGRIFDTVWIIHRNDHLLILTSGGMGAEIITWLKKYIVMEDILLSDVSREFNIDLYFDQNNNFYHSDYFGIPVSFDLKEQAGSVTSKLSELFEQWRIENGIPMANKELVQDFNPLELNLWNWISFTKGCYIGQEVIARLDTYNKIQRTLCQFSATAHINEQKILLDESGTEIGKITSVIVSDNKFIGLAVVRLKFAIEHQKLRTKNSNIDIEIKKVFRKDVHGRN